MAQDSLGQSFSWSLRNIAISAPGENGESGPPSSRRPMPLHWPMQAKLEVGAVDDPLERDADRMAEQVKRLPEPGAAANPTVSGKSSRLQRKCSCGGSCEKCQPEQSIDDERVQRKPVITDGSPPSPAPFTAPPSVHEVLRSAGHPLDTESRALAEPLFGRNFSHVRVHADRRAAESARAVNASAYTVGRHMVFAAGESPEHLSSSRGLLLHELGHTLQQQHAVSTGAPLRISQPGDADERQADAAVRAVLSGAAIPTLGPSSARVARQPKTDQGAAAKGEGPVVDTMKGALVSQIIVSLSQNRVAFQTSRGWVFGDVDTDLTEGSYDLKPEIWKRKWVISKPAVKTGLRFFVDLEGAIPWTLVYPVTLPLTVTSGPLKTEEVEIPDPSGMGYNTIYKNAGLASKEAVLALASVEPPQSSSFPLSHKPLIPDIEAYKKLEAPVRKSILALEPHAAGTACAGWFDVMRANDPDYKPNLTPEQIRAGEAAYYGSTRETFLEKKVESAKADPATADPAKIETKWKENKYGLIAAVQTPNHGIKAEALHAIWIKYWSDKYKLAEELRQAIVKKESEANFDAYFRKLNEFEGGDRNALGPGYARARADIALGDLMFRHSVDAMEMCRAADSRGRSLTLDELNDRVIGFAKVWDPMVEAVEQAVTFGRGVPGPIKAGPIKAEPIKAEPIKAEPVKAEPVKAEPAKTEPVKAEPGQGRAPVKAEPVKAEPAKTEPEIQKPPFEAEKEPEAKKEAEPTKADEPRPSATSTAKPVPEDPQQGVRDALQRTKERMASNQADIDEHAKTNREFAKKVNALYERAIKTPRSDPSRAKLIEELNATQEQLKELNTQQAHRSASNDVVRATRDRLQAALDEKTYARPGFTAAERDAVWQNALKEGNGKVISPSGKEIKPGDSWVMGHRPKYESWKHASSAAKRGISREQFVREYKNLSQYRPETPEDSASHLYEDKTDTYLGH